MVKSHKASKTRTAEEVLLSLDLSGSTTLLVFPAACSITPKFVDRILFSLSLSLSLSQFLRLYISLTLSVSHPQRRTTKNFFVAIPALSGTSSASGAVVSSGQSSTRILGKALRSLSIRWSPGPPLYSLRVFGTLTWLVSGCPILI